MDDIEKNRLDYVVRMEETLQHLQRQMAETKPLADKWTPVIATENTGTDLRITLSFGGKRVTIGIPITTLTATDLTSMTSTVVDSMLKNIVFDALAAIVRPEIEKAQRDVANISTAGKW